MAAKTYREFAASIIDTLESLGITYAIGGSFASNAYGEARRLSGPSSPAASELSMILIHTPRQCSIRLKM